MEWRGRRLVWGYLLVTAAGLAGCADALTVYPVVTAERKAPEVPSITGEWIARGDDGLPEEGANAARLIIEGNEADLRQCRKGHVVFREGSDTTDVGDDVCFVDINGHLVAELQTPQPYVFYRQFLVRVDTDTIAVCGVLPVWVWLAELQDSAVTGYALDSLAFTVRKRRDDDLMVFISNSRELREFLELALPELAHACDRAEAAGKHDADDLTWVVFDRAPPEPEEVAAEE
jgi:hypothetical protein